MILFLFSMTIFCLITVFTVIKLVKKFDDLQVDYMQCFAELQVVREKLCKVERKAQYLEDHFYKPYDDDDYDPDESIFDYGDKGYFIG